MLSDYITINLTQIVNVTFTNNVAPTFASNLKDVSVVVNEKIVVKLPDIYDPDSSQA